MIQPKYNPQESLERIKLIMKYDMSKTATENVIFEQNQNNKNSFFLQNQPSGKKTRPNQPNEKGKVPSMIPGMGYVDPPVNLKNVSKFLKKLDSHDWLTLVEVSSGILGLIPTPLSPLFLGVSLVAGVADAGLYYSEGDPYMGTMMLALSIIPGGELLKTIKGSKVLAKRGIKGSKELIKKFKSGVKLSADESEDLIKLGMDISKNSVEVSKSLKRNIIQNLIKELSNKSPKYLINLLLVLKKMGLIKLSEIVFKVGGTAYGIDKLYLYVFRDSIFANKEALDSRTKNNLRVMINKLLKNDKEVNEFLEITAKESLTKVMNNKNVDLVSINVNETPDEWFKKQSLSKINNIEKEKNSQQKEIIAPSINNVQSGKSIIKLNQKGDSVKEIQKMLYDLGYDYLINNFETLQKWNDGIYGKGTKMAVETFQEDNGLKADGVVNKQTLSKLKEVYNSKIDEKKQ